MFKLGPRHLAALGVVALAPAAAHHSYVMFNQNVTTNVDAVVSTWQFTNPHGKLWMLAANPNCGRLRHPAPRNFCSTAGTSTRLNLGKR